MLQEPRQGCMAGVWRGLRASWEPVWQDLHRSYLDLIGLILRTVGKSLSFKQGGVTSFILIRSLARV